MAQTPETTLSTHPWVLLLTTSKVLKIVDSVVSRKTNDVKRDKAQNCCVWFYCDIAGSHASGTSAITAAVLSVWRADHDTVPEDGYHLARRLPYVDSSWRGRRTRSLGRLQVRSGARYDPVRDTRRATANAFANTTQVRRKCAGRDWVHSNHPLGLYYQTM